MSSDYRRPRILTWRAWLALQSRETFKEKESQTQEPAGLCPGALGPQGEGRARAEHRAPALQGPTGLHADAAGAPAPGRKADPSLRQASVARRACEACRC